MGRRRKRGRDITGILLLDKPTDITSNKALQQAKFLYFAAKAGHTGALDPIATGVLPICFGEATKFSQYLLNADKKYRVTAKLGEKTTTADREGEVIESKPVDVTEEQLVKLLQQFKGTISQVPSMYSALKKDGVPLYKLARKGIEVERDAREVDIYSLELVAFSGDEFVLDVHCSKGTYVRNLVEDIGDELGCGAHVLELRRTAVGGFTLEQTVSMAHLEELKQADAKLEMDELLVPVEQALSHMPLVQLTDDEAYYIRLGQAVQIAGVPVDGSVGLLHDNQFIGVGVINDDGKVAPSRLIRTDEASV
ncbi:tRNA pseudouridine(55) synthase TruB [Kangiella profundi]|uniref:tRNA pseudouridine synthase B n=1 Tax=Kangiella profundi TaxID=1561924 RepID=A0A2K9ANF0_9GAMM|nr:tRNA pseudouridine(55) synthase TruB [Kangiella profundi]AUD77943.1 tRNA pseudouridine(55) synthase TruB [Kangiella profundi]GGE91246.1 tRNA pseudouridine synthase B [Kangiella profundi]